MVLCGLLSCRECNRGTKTAMRDNDVLIDLMQIARKKHVACFCCKPSKFYSGYGTEESFVPKKEKNVQRRSTLSVMCREGGRLVLSASAR